MAVGNGTYVCCGQIWVSRVLYFISTAWHYQSSQSVQGALICKQQTFRGMFTPLGWVAGFFLGRPGRRFVAAGASSGDGSRRGRPGCLFVSFIMGTYSCG